MIVKFSNSVCFVNGTKVLACKLHVNEEEEKKYNGYHRMHCLAELIWTNDIYGLIICVKYTFLGNMHDFAIFNEIDLSVAPLGSSILNRT